MLGLEVPEGLEEALNVGDARPRRSATNAKWIPSQGRRWVEVLDRADWVADLEFGTKIWN
jgi:hypothetical protein